MYLIYQLKPIWTFFRNRLVPSNICFPVKVPVFWYFCNSLSIQLSEENRWHYYRVRRHSLDKSQPILIDV